MGSSDTAAAAPQPIDYEVLYEHIKDKPCHVAHINQRLEGFNGGTPRTKADLVNRELEPVYKAHTLSELQQELDAAGRRLKQLGIFGAIDMLAHEEPLNDPAACTVDVRIEELNWYRLRAATYLQGAESTCEVTAGLLNLTGGAEQLEVNVEYGTESSHTASLSYNQPRVAGLPLTMEVRGCQLFRNNQKASSFTEQLRGAVLGLRSMDGSRALEYELGWRRLMDPSHTASRAVVAQMGDYLKSSLRYTTTLDRRDPSSGGAAAALGGAGWALRSTSEVAGLAPPAPGGVDDSGSTLRFVRQQLDGVLHVPMDDKGAVCFCLGASAGLLLPWGEGAMQRPTCIADRFFLGGASTLRGFKFKGAGPTDVRRPPAGSSPDQTSSGGPNGRRTDSLGGDAFASVFASLMFQLPHPALKLLKLHGHAFVNGGNVIQIGGTGRSPAASLSEFGSTFRWTCGAGVLVPTPLGRFEANYCVLLAKQSGDRVRHGLQFGFAASSVA